MPRQLARHWRAVGGCIFVPDPNARGGSEPIFWRPELSPTVQLLAEAPAEFDAVKPLDRTLLRPLSGAPYDEANRPFFVGNSEGPLQFVAMGDHALQRPAVIVPLDAAMDVRIAALERFVRHLGGNAAGPIPPRLRLTPFQKAHLIQLLQTHDVHAEGGGPRDVAAKVLRSEQAKFRSVEWKDSAARRKAIRLRHDADALVNGGYLKLLKGE